MTTETMRAAICVRAGGPEVLQIREVPVPAVREGWSLVRVKGAGLNRSELRTRQGHSRSVRFPRVLGIECVGIVAASTDPAVPEGTTVAAGMGEVGRGAGLCAGARRGEDGAGLAAHRAPGRDGVRGGLAQRVGDS